MPLRSYVKFFRITAQGIAIASLGTLGMSPTWGAFILGFALEEGK